tara:strand:+ start:401 stop:619 length:219 start_codon:yes stop_codon:yes gene_type:complete
VEEEVAEVGQIQIQHNHILQALEALEVEEMVHLITLVLKVLLELLTLVEEVEEVIRELVLQVYLLVVQAALV